MTTTLVPMVARLTAQREYRAALIARDDAADRLYNLTSAQPYMCPTTPLQAALADHVQYLDAQVDIAHAARAATYAASH